jgi:hypothetical protein
VFFAQRFGSALNLNLHFHALLLDGAFISPSERLAPSFVGKRETCARLLNASSGGAVPMVR